MAASGLAIIYSSLILLKTARFQDARRASDESFHLIRHDPRRFFVDRLQISFLKLRILTFPFSKDTNWIIGCSTGAAARIGMERTTLQDDKKLGVGSSELKST